MESQDNLTWATLGFDRRQATRKAFRAAALLRLPDQRVIEVRTTDISTGGIGLVTSWNLPLGSICDVRVRPPIRSEGLDAILARGRLVHSILSGKEQGFLIGLEFTEVPSAVTEIIEQYLSMKIL